MTDVYATTDDSDDEDDQPAHVSESARREERRNRIWQLYRDGFSVVSIAKSYKVSRKTISNDLKIMKQRLQDSTRSMFASADLQYGEIGRNMDMLDAIMANCMMDYQHEKTNGNDSRAKDRCMNTALRAVNSKIQLQLAAGLIPKAEARAEIVIQKKVTFRDRLGEEHPLTLLDSTPEARQLLDMVAQLRNYEQENPGMVIDLTETPEDEADAA